ncbi:outer membrane protein OmpA-like peptidoglycan-associated protein/DNA-binding SARP family transcriptional activator [Spinactinospora alkalitolerans]|uniref:Outer membrane protein OmpA-like peptidoglycan-associated protein/DNA-binding SARP family transcriptional activator n=1 Tax=Spinactinospora alkalitolerans TaxID=687207 RepID=A0A852U1D7_9ACTN|nr:OmpA family protein [Spinactinospora alkalitolerans]NYE50019.1 outer membrane protein OmpA-like peptidoglycan-associated protein/DNA-binding SARP family transcriptional activator [Spinactinospora alkalitolerans]
MARGIQQLSALLVTIALLTGLPYAAISLPAWPDLELSLTGVLAHLRGGALPPGLGAAALIIALWAVWGLYLLALAAEATARLRGRPPRRRLLGPLQLVAASAIGATLTAPTAHAATTAAPATAEPSTAGTHPSTQPNSTSADELPAGESPSGLVERERAIDGFGYDSALLTEDMREDLEPVVQMIRTHGTTAPITVTGHTDPAGAPDYNQALSERRAEAVAKFLRTQLGEAAPAVQTRGVGSDQLLDGAPDAAQRRVEIAYTVVTRPPGKPTSSEPETAAPQEEQDDTTGDEEGQAVVVLELPSGLLLTATTVGGAVGGFALGRRRRSRPNAPSSQPVEASDDTCDAGTVGDEDIPHSDEAAPVPRIDAHAVIDLKTGLGITGPGAHDAARSLLTAALHTAEETPALNLVIPAADLGLFLGEDGVALLAERETPTITVADSLSDAITLLHAELLLRRPDDDLDEPTKNEDEAPSAAPFLLLAGPDPAHTPEIEALLRQAGTSPVTAVLLGSWPPATCTISGTHTVTTAGPHLAHLHGARWPGTDRGSVLSLLVDLPAATSEPRGRHHGGATPHQNGTTLQTSAENLTRPRSEAEAAASGQEQSPVAVRVLGRITISAHGRPLTLRRRSAFEVTAYLAAHPDGVMLERAVEDMWPGENAARSTRRFHDATSALRTALRDVLTDDERPVILHENDRYRLNPELVGVDVWDLEAAITQAEDDGAEGSPQPPLRHAVADYADFAAEAGYAWAEEIRLRLRRRLVDAVLRCASHSGHDDARTLLSRAVAIDPHSEDAHLALIRLHLDHGDTRAATNVYRNHEQALREIDAAPTTRIRDLIENIPESA